MIDLRRHIIIGSDLCASAGLLYRLGDPKIAKLIVAVSGSKDIGRFDIPMDDVMFLAEHQCLANVCSDLDDLLV